jgi:hypothetical protein
MLVSVSTFTCAGQSRQTGERADDRGGLEVRRAEPAHVKIGSGRVVPVEKGPKRGPRPKLRRRRVLDGEEDGMTNAQTKKLERDTSRAKSDLGVLQLVGGDGYPHGARRAEVNVPQLALRDPPPELPEDRGMVNVKLRASGKLEGGAQRSPFSIRADVSRWRPA